MTSSEIFKNFKKIRVLTKNLFKGFKNSDLNGKAGQFIEAKNTLLKRINENNDDSFSEYFLYHQLLEIDKKWLQTTETIAKEWSKDVK